MAQFAIITLQAHSEPADVGALAAAALEEAGQAATNSMAGGTILSLMSPEDTLSLADHLPHLRRYVITLRSLASRGSLE